jgi:hypothetical protein
MESLDHLKLRIGGRNQTHCASFWSAPAERSDDGAFDRSHAMIGHVKAASRFACRRAPKTARTLGWFMGSFHFLLNRLRP